MKRKPSRPYVPQSLAALRAMPVPVPTHLVELIEDDPRFDLKAGDRFTVSPYLMDPGTKWVIHEWVGREGDNPGCNLYRSQVKVVQTL